MQRSANDQLEALGVEIRAFLEDVRIRQRNNFWLGRGLVLLGIGLAAASAIAGFSDAPKLALVLAAIAAATAAIDSAFAIRDVAEFQRIIASETKNLLSPITIGAALDTDLPRTQEAFYALRKNFDQSLPRGTGMEAVKKLMDDLGKAKKPPA